MNWLHVTLLLCCLGGAVVSAWKGLFASFRRSATTSSIFTRSIRTFLSPTTVIDTAQPVSTLPRWRLTFAKPPTPGFLQSIHISDQSDLTSISSLLVQERAISVPRSHYPTYLIINGDKVSEKSLSLLLEQSLMWYCDRGGRLQSLSILCPSVSYTSFLSQFGFQTKPPPDTLPTLVQETVQSLSISSPLSLLSLHNSTLLISSLQQSLSQTSSPSRLYSLNNLIGRVYHDIGQPQHSLSYYTEALRHTPSNTTDPVTLTTTTSMAIQTTPSNHSIDDETKTTASTSSNSQSHTSKAETGSYSHSYDSAVSPLTCAATTFRHLGSAYHALQRLPMAHASYQQSVSLCPEDSGLTYLKLAFLYEELSQSGYEGATASAEQCYEYYLREVDPEDTSVWLRLGNLCYKEGGDGTEKAQRVYAHALSLLNDTETENALSLWHNYALCAHKNRDDETARDALSRVLSLCSALSNSSVSSVSSVSADTLTFIFLSATHMLSALSPTVSNNRSTTEREYVRRLFDSYSSSYDKHCETMLYTAPRVVRQELSRVYMRLRENKITEIDRDKNRDRDTDRDKVVLRGGVPSACASSLSSPSSSSSSLLLSPSDPCGHNHNHVDDSCSHYPSSLSVSRSLSVLDLGAGTGLVGAWVKEYSRSITAVDLSSKMLQKAREKGIYDRLIERDIEDWEGSDTDREGHDLVLLVDVSGYLGDMSRIMAKVYHQLKPGGLFVFTAERLLTEAEDPIEEVDWASSNSSVPLSVDSTPIPMHRGYQLQRTGRFGHSAEYLERVIAETWRTESRESEAEILRRKPFTPRLEHGEPMRSLFYIVRRRGNNSINTSSQLDQM